MIKKVMKFFKNTKVQLLIIACLTLIVYSNVFANGFVSDDKIFLVEWKTLKNFSNLKQILTQIGPDEAYTFRPVRNLIITSYNQFFGGGTFIYHLHSILVHLGVTVLVYFIVQAIFATKTDKSYKTYIPFVTALLFGLHPIHTEPVAFMNSAIDTTGSLFFFAAFYLYILSRSRGDNSKGLYIGAVLLSMAAYLTSELTLSLPVLIIVYEYFFQKAKKIDMVTFFKRLFPFWAGFLTYFVIRVVFLGHSNFIQNQLFSDVFFQIQTLAVKGYMKYLILLFAPLGLSYNHMLSPGFETFSYFYNDFTMIRSQSFFNPEVILSFSLIAVLVLTAVFIRKRNPLFSFAVVWFFVSLIPVSNILPQPTIIAERYLYIGSFGFVLALSYLILSLKTGFSFFVVVLLTVLYGQLTFIRNQDWKDDISLWNSVIRVYPGSVIAYNSLGRLYNSKKEFTKAISSYTKALDIRPNFYKSVFGLGYAYENLGNLEQAEKLYKQVLQINPNFLEGYSYLGSFYYNRSQFNQSKKILLDTQDIDLNKTGMSLRERKIVLSQADTILASIYIKEGRLEEAKSKLRAALSLDPENRKAWIKLDGISNTERYSSYRISFDYPADWQPGDNRQDMIVLTKGKNEKIYIYSMGKLFYDFSKFVSLQEGSKRGELVKQNYINLPNTEKAYVKLWRKNKINELEFYILKEGNLLKISVIPSDPQVQDVFDEILGSLKIF